MTESLNEPVFPIAEIAEVRSGSRLLLRLSRLWWLTLMCLLLAFYLAWKSLPATGPAIVIHFPDGHGLKAGDSLRHRGINIGAVSDVSLKPDLSAITATVILTREAADLARAGTRFWIVRPQLSLIDGVSGLETAVGAKYIAVNPGDATAVAAGKEGSRQTVFEGLASVPPDEAAGDGIDIILRSDQQYGIRVGSPLTWRGVDVGKILSVNLSPDARFVDVHARLDVSFRRLLRSNSRFWVNSGMAVDIGLTGVRINADSLTAIIRGGVSFATPAADGTVQGNDPSTVSAGHIFTLHRQADAEWLNAGTSIPLIDVTLPQTVTVHGSRKSSLLGISRNKAFTHHGILIQWSSDSVMLFTAAEGIADSPLAEQSQDSDTDHKITLTIKSAGLSDSIPLQIELSAIQWAASGIAAIPVKPFPNNLPTNAGVQLRVPLAPEECCITRSVRMAGKDSSVIQSIGRHQLEAADGYWKVTLDAADLTSWHGAPVVAMNDGHVLGLFLNSPRGPIVATLPSEITDSRAGQQ